MLSGVELLERVAVAWEPPPRLTVSEFADAEVVVTSGPLSHTRWQTDFAPYQRGILDAFHEPGIEIVVVQSSAQIGKTSIAVAVVAYHIAHDPCPILIVEPTVDPMAKDFAKNRLEPIIEATPVLRDAVSKKRAKDAQNTILQKTFRNGSLSIGGANSAASLAARSIRLLVLDEVDRYPAELPGEGSTISIAFKRTAAYLGRRRIMMFSTPTLRGGAIDEWFQAGDQRRFHVPCPSCGHRHAYEWKNVRRLDGRAFGEPDDSQMARLMCPECGYAIDEAERVAILAQGEWVAAQPDRVDTRIASFHVWEAYSPFSTLAEIVSGFRRARRAMKAGDPSEMHTFQNTTLGEPLEPEEGTGVESSSLLVRREVYEAPAPAGVCCVTMGVDTQDDRLEALVYGWGVHEESWLLHRAVLPGDTSQREPWDLLAELLDREFRHETGALLPIHATCVDSAGHRTDKVYDFVKAHMARRVYATVGRDGDRPIVSAPSKKRTGRDPRKVPLYTVGVDQGKALFVNRLSVTTPGRGYVHLPATDWCNEDLAAQLTSERLHVKFTAGRSVQVWRKVRPSARNEGLDCSVLAIAALRLLSPDLEGLARRLTLPATPPATDTQAPAREPWVPKKKGWLR